MTPVDLALLVALGVAFWLLLIRPARVRREAQAALAASLAPGVRIMTTAGVFGTVVGIDDDRMRLEIAPGVIVEMVTAATGRIVEDLAEPPDVPQSSEQVADPAVELETPTTQQEADRG